MEYHIAESARRAVKRYNSAYDIVPVVDPLNSVDEPLMIAKKIRVVDEVVSGLFVVRTEWFPQLYIDSAICEDNRWFRTLDQAKIANVKSLILEDSVASQHARNLADAEAMAEQEADELYYYFKKQYSGYNMSNIKSVDPMEEVKKMQDRLGRELR